MNPQIEAFYPIIGQQAVNAVPIDFSKRWVRVEMMDDASSIAMFSQTAPNHFRYVNDGLEGLRDTFQALRDTFATTAHKPFSSATFVFTDTGKFSIDFGYDDVSDFGQSNLRREAWIKKYLGEDIKIQWD